MGVHRDQLAPALRDADMVLLLQPAELKWDINAVLAPLAGRARSFTSVEAIVDALAGETRPDDHVVIMSNGGFDGIHNKLLARLRDMAGMPA
jgi:UDP-N-acetylmuramate: L-alanyl-gamma-D-glutamyl-meso-diaminopimelate ligase